MPVDTTRVISPRRTQKKLTEEELKDIDRKRLLGELSCAECRRLKLRCDKKLPCGSCYRRGCESICPLGILAAGQGTRFILADTQQLHDKIYEMSNRIRQLEDALAILQSTVSDHRHPLLSDELLRIKFGSEAINPRQTQATETDVEASTTKSIDALGTLTLGSSGEVHYFGGSAGSETLMMRAGEEAEASEDEDKDTSRSSQDIFFEVDKLANLFPFATRGRRNTQGMEFIQGFFPTSERAAHLCDSYIKHASYFFRPIKADDLLQRLLPGVYDKVATRMEEPSKCSPRKDQDDYDHPHSLAILYFIFALGCLLDLSRPPYNSEAERYYDLGRAALSLRSVYDSPNMESVQAMGLMATYHTLAGKKYSRDSAWCVMSFAAKLAQSIGLHRDSSRWNMDSATVQRRRNLFWEIFSADVSNSLALGRPPAIHLSYVDCEFPLDDDASLSSTAEHEDGFWRMKHKFAKNIYNSVADATLTAKSPSYHTVLDLDRKVREMSFPASFNPYVTKDVGLEIFHSSSLSLRDFYASQHRTVTMLYLHRSFFAQAMLDHPTNPLLSPFAPSFLTAYRSASVIIKASAHLFERCAPMAMRLWFLINHTFSAAVIVGTVVTRSPNSTIASIAMRDFNVGLDLFEKTATQSQRAKIALKVLLKLQEKAKRSYEQISGSSSPAPTSFDNTEEFEDDLAIFGGQMKVLDRKSKHSHQRSSSTSTASTSPAPQSPPPSSSVSPVMSNTVALGLGLDLPDVHPSLITYLNQDAVRKAMNQGPGQGGNVPGSKPRVSDTVFSGVSATGGGASTVTLRYPPAEQEPRHRLSAAATGGGTASNVMLPYPSAEHEDIQARQRLVVPGNKPQSHSDPYPRYGPSSDDVQLQQTRSVNTNFSPQSQAVPRPYPSGPAAQTRNWSDLPSFGNNTDSSMSRPGFNAFSASDDVQTIPMTSSALTPFSSGPSNSQIYSGENIHPLQQPGNTNLNQTYTPQFYQSSGDFNFVTGQSGQDGRSGLGSQFGMGASGSNMRGSAFVDLNSMWSGEGMNFAGAVEMGLSSESGMDARWMSLMRDCGIMDVEQ